MKHHFLSQRALESISRTKKLQATKCTRRLMTRCQFRRPKNVPQKSHITALRVPKALEKISQMSGRHDSGKARKSICSHVGTRHEARADAS